ncbi:hypothetical protein N658DRAFT_298974 [Parathielavia hyrcaniae]|uniref:Uncharacterized protein n=1 Tax=Parathielavia hyrcaniae TaxID=113614 RepID=A0AAN6T3M9_9PEZI|nr:hypothetical protein N658DRAFT_298974 [Parathielavia hyrcaniae]
MEPGRPTREAKDLPTISTPLLHPLEPPPPAAAAEPHQPQLWLLAHDVTSPPVPVVAQITPVTAPSRSSVTGPMTELLTTLETRHNLQRYWIQVVRQGLTD